MSSVVCSILVGEGGLVIFRVLRKFLDHFLGEKSEEDQFLLFNENRYVSLFSGKIITNNDNFHFQKIFISYSDQIIILENRYLH